MTPGTATLCRKHGVMRPALFGSVARGDMTTASDLNLLVEFMPDKWRLLQPIERLIDVLSITDRDDEYEQLVAVDGVNDAIVTGSATEDSRPISSDKFQFLRVVEGIELYFGNEISDVSLDGSWMSCGFSCR